MEDMTNKVLVKQSLAPAARTATANGTSVDLQGYEAALIEIQSGARTDGTHTYSLQESDDDTTFTNVAAGDLIGTLPAVAAAGDANKAFQASYIGNKRYIRVVVTVAGATTGAVGGASVVLGSGRHMPPGKPAV